MILNIERLGQRQTCTLITPIPSLTGRYSQALRQEKEIKHVAWEGRNSTHSHADCLQRASLTLQNILRINHYVYQDCRIQNLYTSNVELGNKV